MSQEILEKENENGNGNDIAKSVDAIDAVDNDKSADVGEVVLAVKKQGFKKYDILVLIICIVTSVLIWLYASNKQKIADEEAKKQVQNVLDEKEEKDKEKEAAAERQSSEAATNATEASTEAAQ